MQEQKIEISIASTTLTRKENNPSKLVIVAEGEKENDVGIMKIKLVISGVPANIENMLGQKLDAGSLLKLVITEADQQTFEAFQKKKQDEQDAKMDKAMAKKEKAPKPDGKPKTQKPDPTLEDALKEAPSI